MAAIQRKYATLGLRQDLNLTDIDDKTAALNNLLDNLVNDGAPGETFTSEDLNALRGLQSLNLDLVKLSDIAGLTVKYTTLTEVNGVTISTSVPVKPAIRIKDRVESAKSITGDIPGIRGGLGPLARFIPSYDWNTGTQSSTGSTIFNLTADQETEVFWAAGYFDFSGSIDRTFGDQYGGIQWTGYFTPIDGDADPVITFSTTGLFMFEYDRLQDGNWTMARSIYAPARTLNVLNTNTVDQTIIELKPGQAKYTAIGDFVGNPALLITVTAVNLLTDTLTLSDAYPVTANGTVTMTAVLGDTALSGNISLPFVELTQQIKIRITWWYPANSGNLIEKNLNLNYISSDLPYPYLYAEKPSSVFGPFEIRKFLTEVVTPYQPEVGVSGANKNLYVSNSYLTNYSPKGRLTDIKLAGPVTVTFTTENNTMRSAVSMLGSQIGSVVVPTTTKALTKITSLVQIKNSYSNLVKTIPFNLGVNASEAVNFIDHRGLVTWFYGNVNGTTVTIVNSGTTLSTLKTGMIVIPERTIVIASIVVGATTTINTTGNHGFVINQTIFITGALGSTAINGTWTITSITSTTAFVISVATTGTTYTANSGRLYPAWTTISSITPTTGTPTSFVTNFPLQPSGAAVETVLYVYANRGLLDTSKDVACVGVFGYNITTTVPPGSLTIQLSSVAGITNGLYAQYTGSIATGTTVTNVNTGTNTITLSAVTIAEIKSPGIIVFANTAASKEACVVPLDTAPPFLGTIDGLSTDGKGLKSAASVDTFTVNAGTLSLNIPTAHVVALSAAQSVTAAFNRKIRINSPYFIIPYIVVGATTTIYTSSPHGYVNGASVAISGATGITSINGTWTISGVGVDSFTIAVNTTGLTGYVVKSAKVGTTVVYSMLGLV